MAAAAWLRLAAVVSLVCSIFCGTVCVGIGPGFVIVVMVVGIMRVDMVSIVGRYIAAASIHSFLSNTLL